MKNIFKFLSIFLSSALLVTACSDDDNDDNNSSSADSFGAYVINYGSYDKANSSITKFDYSADQTTEFYYEQQNGATMVSSIQYALEEDNKVYLIGNSPDQILVTNDSFVAIDTLTDMVEKPRYAVEEDNFLYISCWGADADFSTMPNSYILKYDILNDEMTKIACPGGPEGLAIENGKLYIALGYAKGLAVMDLNTEAMTSIATGAAASYFVEDNADNLYVGLVSTYSLPAENAGLGYINTTTNTLDTIYALADISSTYAKTIDIADDGSKVYVVASVYDEDYNKVGGVQVFNTSTKTFDATPIVEGKTGINAVTVNPDNDDLYVFYTTGTVDKGSMEVYTNGSLAQSHTVGAAPALAIFID